MMKRAPIRNAIEATSFKPFRIWMADGRAHDVPHREFIAQHPDQHTVIVFKDDGGFAVLDHLTITTIEVSPPKNGSKTNGKSAKKTGGKKGKKKS